ncbi:MAG: aldo/keto reductase [Mycobacterium sp.]
MPPCAVPHVRFHNGVDIPQLGLGVAAIPDGEAETVVRQAIEAGYRHIDTATKYGNERGVGLGISRSAVPREDVFITTKLWVDDFRDVANAFSRSLDALGTGYVDLFLIHWPAPHHGQYVAAWRQIVQLYLSGAIRAIGVSNFEPEHVHAIVDETGVLPVVNQVELHPYFQQRELRQFNADREIVTEAWSPLAQGIGTASDSPLATLAAKYNKTTAQLILRWHIELGHVVIPKTCSPHRLAENLQIFDFSLSPEDFDVFTQLDSPEGRLGNHPNDGFSAHHSPRSRWHRDRPTRRAA